MVVTLSSAQETASFARDIQPILENSCWKCHGEAMQLSKLDLRTLEGALKGGEKGAAIVPGKSDESRLYRRVAGLEKPAMPMGETLTGEQISAIKAWIDQGAHWDNASVAKAQPLDRAALAALENMEISPEAQNYWAFKLPVQASVPAVSANLKNPIDLRSAPGSSRTGRAGKHGDLAGSAELLGIQAPGPGLCARRLGKPEESDRSFSREEPSGKGPQSRAASRPANASAPGLSRPDRTAAHARRNGRVCVGQYSRLVGAIDRQTPCLAALRRTLGPSLAQCCAVCGQRWLRTRLRPRQCLDVSGLRGSLLQPGQALQCFYKRADRR